MTVSGVTNWEIVKADAEATRDRRVHPQELDQDLVAFYPVQPVEVDPPVDIRAQPEEGIESQTLKLFNRFHAF